jgi:hypothetical protein
VNDTFKIGIGSDGSRGLTGVFIITEIIEHNAFRRLILFHEYARTYGGDNPYQLHCRARSGSSAATYQLRVVPIHPR